MKTLKGHISMHRHENKIQSDDPNAPLAYHMEIVVGDEASARKFLTIRIDPAELVAAMTGGARRPMEYEFDEKTLATIGHQREHKRFGIRDRGTDKMIVPQRILDEGWQYSHGYSNQHTAYTKNNKRYYQCMFLRYVPEADSTFDEEPELPWEDQRQPRKDGLNPVGKPMRKKKTPK